MKGTLLHGGRPRLLLGAFLMVAIALGTRAIPRSHAVVAKPAQPVAIASLAPAAPVAPAPVPAKHPAPARIASIAPPATAGMRAYIDPETGRLGPRPQGFEDGAALPDLNDSGEGFVEVPGPNGSWMIDLQGRFQDYAVMTIGPDGRLVMSCVRNPKLLLQNGPAAQPQPEER
jgi:hypothetical protein